MALLTVHALTNDNQLVRVRLKNIDAPKKGQAFGQAAKQNLSQYIFGRDVELHVFGTDRYGRLLAVIMLDGVDMNLQQVRDGYAWVYEKYIGENSPGVQARRGCSCGSAIPGLLPVNSPNRFGLR